MFSNFFELKNYYVKLRAVEVLSDLAFSITDDCRENQEMFEAEEYFVPFLFELQNLHIKANSMLKNHITPQLTVGQQEHLEQLVGEEVKRLAGRSGLGKYLHLIIEQAESVYGRTWHGPWDDGGHRVIGSD